MIFDTDLLLKQSQETHRATGESYFALRLEITIHSLSHGQIDSSVGWSSYTPRSGHTGNFSSPADAIRDTLTACSDPGKLAAQADALEAEARKIRARIGGMK